MITVFKTNSMKSAAEYIADVLKRADKTKPDVRHTVLVPDRASLEAERSLLKNVGGSFNIQVRTFRRFAGEVLPKYAYLGKQAGIIALTGIIQDNRDKLCCYTKGVDTPGFVSDMYETISKLKYCKILPEQLTGEFPRSVAGKIKDIALLYSLYRDYTEGRYIDSADKIDLLCEAISVDPAVSDGYFYLYDFDNLSRQELSVVENLMKYSRGVTVACCAADDLRDRHLYLNDIYEGVMSVCRRNGIEPNVIERKTYGNAVTEQIGRGLFRYTEVKAAECGDFIEIFMGNTRVQEVYALACRVQKYVRSGGRFRDVYVVTSDLDKYVNAVSTVFDEFDIPYFCDRQAVLSDQAYVRFICDYAAMCRNNFKLSSVLPFVKNYLFCGEDYDVCLFENYCLKYNVSYDFSEFTLGKEEEELFAAADRVRDRLYTLTRKIIFPASGSASAYAQIIRELITETGLDAVNEAFSLRQAQEGLEFQSKVTAQTKDKFRDVLNQAESVIGERVARSEDFMRVLGAALSSVSVSVLPVYSDCVVFANMAKARKHDIKFLALLGANYGAMPIIKSDCSLLTDANIEELAAAGIYVEPGIQTENKRERFSLFQLLQEPSEKLYVSYASADGKDSLLPSPFVEQLTELFTVRGKALAKTDTTDEEVYTEKQALSKLILNKRRMKDNMPVRMPAFSVLYGVYKNQTDALSFDKDGTDIRVDKGKNLFLRNSETSVTKITDFFKCPFGFFFRYGLAVKPRPAAELKSADLGNILHAVLEKYVADIDCAETDAQTRQTAGRIYDGVMKNDFYKGLNSDPSMRNQLAQLKKEAVRMCVVVKKQLSCSSFVNYAAELSFGGKSAVKPVEVSFGEGRFLLVGKIDRVDVWNNKFIVLDYKSGGISARYSEKELYIGHKLQLPVYVKVVRDNFGWEPAGFYYFNMHNNFTDVSEQKVYVYNGRTLDDAATAQALDNALAEGSSEKLGLKLKKDGSDFVRQGGKLLTAEQIDCQVRYAVRLIAEAGRHMSEGYAAVSPYEGACEYCDYADVCDYNDVYVYGERKVSDKVTADVIGRAADK